MIGITVQLNDEEKLHGYLDDITLVMVDIHKKKGKYESIVRFEGVDKSSEQWLTWADTIVANDSKIVIEIDNKTESSKPIRHRANDLGEDAMNRSKLAHYHYLKKKLEEENLI